MHHLIRSISVIDSRTLTVQFKEGVTKIWSLNELIETFEPFKKFLSDEFLIYQAKTDKIGSGIVWNDELDIDCNYVFEHGIDSSSQFDNLIAIADATLLWDLNESTLRKAIQYGKLKKGVDCVKFGSQWVFTKESLMREYGEMRN